MSDNELDNLFKEAAEGFKAPKDPSAWKDMSSRLDQAGVGTSVFWNWKTISVITAVGIIATSSIVWIASQKDVDQPVVNVLPNEQTESSTLKPNQPPQEKAAEVNAVSEQKEQSASSSNARESQKGVSENKSVIATTAEASNPNAVDSRTTPESVNVASQGGGDQSKTTQRTESKATPLNTSTENKASVPERSQQKATGNESQLAEAAIIPTGAVVAKGSAAPETKIAPNASSDSKSSSAETSQQKVTGNEGKHAEAVAIPVGAVVVKGSIASEAKIASSTNASTDSKANSAETNQQKSSTNEKQLVGAMIIPAGVANESNVSKTEKQNVKSDENQISISNTSQNRGVNQETSDTPILTDSVIKPVEDLPVVAERADSVSKKTVPKEEKTKAATALSIKLAVAPDFSSINYFTPDGSGFNFGALVGYSFNNRWSVYTGAILSRKIYSSTEIDEPYTTSGGYPYDINELEGDCRVIDIPINVYYTFFPEKSFSIKAGLGFTSYLMLSEEYTYYIDNPYGSDVYHQKIENENNEWFKMLNISMIVQKRLSDRFALELEPFLKAPLAGVGEGEVSLVSLGAFLNLRFDIPINKQKE